MHYWDSFHTKSENTTTTRKKIKSSESPLKPGHLFNSKFYKYLKIAVCDGKQ